MNVIAHRGFCEEAPENTVVAFERAAGRADAVEFDVRRCASGEIVVFHDETVDRATDGTGPVAEHTLSELRSLRVDGSDVGVPTLEEVLDAVDPGLSISIELKERGVAEEVLETVSERPHDVVLSSFDTGALAEVREVDESAPRAFITRGPWTRPFSVVDRLGCSHLHLRWQACLLPGMVRLARRRDLVVNAWTIRRPSVARTLDRIGVDGIAVDRLDVVPDSMRPDRR